MVALERLAFPREREQKVVLSAAPDLVKHSFHFCIGGKRSQTFVALGACQKRAGGFLRIATYELLRWAATARAKNLFFQQPTALDACAQVELNRTSVVIRHVALPEVTTGKGSLDKNLTARVFRPEFSALRRDAHRN